MQYFDRINKEFGTTVICNLHFLSLVRQYATRVIALKDGHIVFEGNAKYGYAVCIDDVEVSSACSTIYPVGVAISATANPVITGTTVTFTAAPVNGGPSPAFRWKLNGSYIPGATNSTYSYTPENHDTIACQLTSSLSCVSGNPATSNTIVMTVTGVAATVTLLDLTVADSFCFDAVQTITVAGDGHSFTIIDGGIVTMIAGQSILYLSGASVLSGGYLYGYIAPDGPFCNAPAMVKVVNSDDEIIPSEGSASGKVYPNPTSGQFRLELNGFGSAEQIRVDIFNMQGERISSRDVPADQTHEFSLSGNPPGIYLVLMCGRSTNESIRVIKL